MDWRCDVLVHGKQWVFTGFMASQDTTKEALDCCRQAAIDANEKGGGDGDDAVVPLFEEPNQTLVGWGLEDDAAAGAILVRWVLGTVKFHDLEEEVIGL